MSMRTFLEKTPDFRNRSSFKFYVPTALSVEELPLEETEQYSSPQPNVLSGEIIIQEAHKVVLFPNPIDRKKGIIGNLYVTNFRLFHLPTHINEAIQLSRKQVNLLVGEYGICLTNVASLYHVSANKSRALLPNSKISGRIKCLRIVCKNMRVMTLGFDSSPFDHGKLITQTLLHHAFPRTHCLLFAYDYSEQTTAADNDHGIPSFATQLDWDNELHRTCRMREDQWRVSSVNEGFDLTHYLPEWLVVPKSFVDSELKDMARQFCCNRPPTWSWSHPNGASLVRMADCLPAITERRQENIFMERLRALHPLKTAPVMMELDVILPSYRDIHLGCTKLREICIPDSRRMFDVQDSKFYTILENSKWLNYVSNCLKEASNAGKRISSGVSVVLQESNGRDTSALISSLVQIMLDPFFRTLKGFQTLIQKEWVAMGHPFSTRLGHISTQEQSEIFLLFLDCIWQLQHQFVTSFEFSETYLTSLFDSSYMSIFDTFLFDSLRDRDPRLMKDQLKFKLRSVWNWSKQFNDSDIRLFSNPLYKRNNLICSNSPKTSQTRIEPLFEIYYMELWQQCYFRWQPTLSIRGGGRAFVDQIHFQLDKEISELLDKLESCTNKLRGELVDRGPLVPAQCLPLSDILPDMPWDHYNMTSSFPFAVCDDPPSLADCSIYSEFDNQSVLNLTD